VASDRNDERLAAPGDLELVRDFVNTLDILPGADKFADPSGLALWLADHRLVPLSPALTDKDLSRAKKLREALRAFLLANARLPLAPEAAEAFDDAAGPAHLRARADERGRLELLPVEEGGAGSCHRPIGCDRVRGAAGRDLVPFQGLRRMPLGALRPHQEPLRRLVRLPVRSAGAFQAIPPAPRLARVEGQGRGLSYQS
jgi:Putative stress-induced transcription regulator